MAKQDRNMNGYSYDFSEIEDVGSMENLMSEVNTMKGLRNAMARYTVSWPHEGLDPHNPDDYLRLSVRAENGRKSQWMEAKEKFLEAMQNFLGVEN